LRRLIVDLIDKEPWSALSADVKGDIYEGLLEKNAQDTKSGAGRQPTTGDQHPHPRRPGRLCPLLQSRESPSAD
jgi:hypothetical protein